MRMREKTEDRGRTSKGILTAPLPGSGGSGKRELADGLADPQATACETLADACEGCPLSHESRAMGHESRQLPPCCGNCTYCGRMRDGDTCVPICANTPNALGEIVRIDPAGKCPNHCRKPEPVIRDVPPEPPSDDIRYIPLTKGKFAIVDAADYQWLSRYKWHVVAPGKEYAGRKQHGRTVYMHREIMQPPAGLMVDHIDGNGFNNCRRNLRNCTNQQNMQNIRKPPRADSRYKGVYYDKRRGTYSAKICHNCKSYHLGTFATEIEAALAYDRKAVELFGEFARLNFPQEVECGSVEACKRGCGEEQSVARADEAGGEGIGDK